MRRKSASHRSNEPMFWSLFSAGGVLTALFVPALIIIVGFLVPAGDVSFSRLHGIFTNVIGRLVLFGLAGLTFVHAAHRLRHVLVDMGLRRYGKPIMGVCYLVAGIGTVWAATVAFT